MTTWTELNNKRVPRRQDIPACPTCLGTSIDIRRTFAWEGGTDRVAYRDWNANYTKDVIVYPVTKTLVCGECNMEIAEIDIGTETLFVFYWTRHVEKIRSNNANMA